MRFLFVFFSAFTFAQHTQSIDFKTIHASIIINPMDRNVIGKGTYTFEVTNKIDTIKIDAVRMGFSNVKINDREVPFMETNKNLLLYKGYKKGENILTFDYEAKPSQGMYFVNWEEENNFLKVKDMQGQVWTLGQGKENSHWLPSFDDVNEKVIFSLDISFQKSFEVVSNGILMDKIANGDNIKWQYKMVEPLSSCQLMISIGHYNKKEEVSSSGIPMQFYYEKIDSNRVEPTYRYTKRIFEYFEKELELPYRWTNYKEIPVNNFIYSGKGNTMVTLFSRNSMVDSIGFVDKSYVNLNANLLIRQWFDDFITSSDDEKKWLQEEFASYFTLLAEKEIFGEDYFYNKLYTISVELKSKIIQESSPVFIQKKGILALHYIRESVGSEKFNYTLKHFLVKYNCINFSIDEFLIELSKESDFNSAYFKKIWSEDSNYPEAEINSLLEKNDFIKQLIDLQKNPLSIVDDKVKILEIVNTDTIYYPVKTQFINQSVSLPFEEKEYLLKTALKSDDIKIRQSVAYSFKNIPESFRLEYETLLFDKSYITQENALINLWKQFPEHQIKYIKLSADWIGFQDKNLRIEHLFLAYLTLQDQGAKFKIYRELLDYTEINYDSDVRQNAIEKLLALDMNTEAVFLSLVNGTCSYQKPFNKYSKDTIRKLLKNEKNKILFIKIRQELPNREKVQLQKLLSEM